MRQGEIMQLEIPRSPEYVAIARHAVEGIARRMRFAPNQIEDLKLAVGEACTNAVKHGCATEDSPTVEIKCVVLPEGLSVEIRNGIEAGELPCIPVKPDPTKEGGFGLYMIRQLMDEVILNWDANTAIIKMLKKIGASAV
ncbi:MAG: ATP-binding protein [Armatimonadota bacterium]|nr:ATP-binding protein [bacterium]